MVGELIMLPLRFGVRATQMWLRIAEETASVAANATGRLIGAAAVRGSSGHDRSATEIHAPEQPQRSAPERPEPTDTGAREVDSPAAEDWPAAEEDSSLIGADSPAVEEQSSAGATEEDPSAAEVSEPEAPSTAVRPAAATPPPSPQSSSVPPRAESQPSHVSEEPELVEELAEPGAQDGAGAEVHIEEPWEGYGKLTAKQVIARLDAATSAELAAVQLYEGTHRRRQTILNVVQRELRSNGGSSRSQ